MADANPAVANGADDPPGAVLFDSRSIYLGTEINQESALQLVMQLQKLNTQDPRRPIKLFIDSPGGEVGAGMWIYDVIQSIDAPVWTICTSKAYSMAALLLLAGDEGHRYAFPHSRIMVHMASGFVEKFGGPWTAWQKQADELRKLQEETLDPLLRRHTGAHADELIARMLSNGDAHDVDLSPAEAKRLGIIDHVVPAHQVGRGAPRTPDDRPGGSGRVVQIPVRGPAPDDLARRDHGGRRYDGDRWGQLVAAIRAARQHGHTSARRTAALGL